MINTIFNVTSRDISDQSTVRIAPHRCRTLNIIRVLAKLSVRRHLILI